MSNSPSLTAAIRSSEIAYAERKLAGTSGLDHLYHRYVTRHLSTLQLTGSRYGQLIEKVIAGERELTELADGELKDRAGQLKRDLRLQGLNESTVASGFALVREVSRRMLGMRHYRTQIHAGLVMLDGAIAEMQTGEGKTLAVTLPAALVAMAGVPVHVITVNDYLANRDAEQMKPLYTFLGLSVGEIVSTSEAEERQRSYRCDVAYCSNNEIVFDYLRDRLTLGSRGSPAHLQFESLYGDRSRLRRLFLQGLRFAIVDEADSVLVDETRTPLILSAPGSEDGRADIVDQALAIQRSLEPGRDFVLDRSKFAVSLNPSGRETLASAAAGLDGVWQSTRLGEQLLKQAIAANYLYLRDEHYVVRDGKVLIVDPHTGRVMPGRTWSEGMHQFVEAKEGCEITPDPSVLARVSYQSFFRRYIALSGMTGTAREVRGELWNVYSLNVVTIPPRQPSKRKFLGRRVLPSLDDKWRSVVAAVSDTHRLGRPVLVGTSNVATSEHLSALLTEAGLQHELLNAKQDSREAEIVARAGGRARITVATNMAGRGTDIRLGPSVTELGGLHVILTEYHDAARIDRQLIGRCARQGDPGSYQVIASLEDPVVEHAGKLQALVIRGVLRSGSPAIIRVVGAWALRLAQRRLERQHSKSRQNLLRADETLNSRLAFAGRAE